MATASLLPLPRAVFYDANGSPLAGGYVYTYVPGGTVPATTWQDANETTPNSNPIVLDANGSCLLYGSGSYQITVTDGLGNQVPAYSGLTVDTLSQATSGGSSSIAYLPPFPGGVSETITAKLSQYISVADFGAVGNGTTDDFQFIQNAINAVAGIGGGILFFPPGNYAISSTLVVSTSNIRMIGSGRGGNHDLNPVISAATTLQWIGANGGTMVKISSTGSNSQRIEGWEFSDIALVSGVFPYTSAADIGIELSGIAYGKLKVTTIEFKTNAVVTTGPASLGENSLFQFNDLDIIARQINTPGTVLQMGGTAGVNNSCFNRVWIEAEYNDGIGIDLQDADNNTFYETYLQLASGGTGSPMILRGGTASTPGYARNNIFVHYSESIEGGTIVSEGLGTYGSRTITVPAVENQIMFYDTANAAFSLSLGTNSSFWTGKNTTPVGLYDLFIGDGTGYKSDNAGLYEIWGVTAPIADNTGVDITFPNGFTLPNGIFLGAFCSGANTAEYSITSPTSTGFHLFVGMYPSPASAIWYWRAWGR